MDRSAPPTFVFVLFPFLFVGIWCSICLILSVTGGWRRLADRFPARGKPSGQRFFMQSGKVGGVSYNNCLTIYTSPEGLYLSVWLPLRLGHPPVLIPWDAVRNATTRRSFWAERVLFDVGSPTVATLQLSKKIFEGYNIV